MTVEDLPTADYLVKMKGCPTCEGEDTGYYYKRRHVDIDGEYYEFLTESQIKELYSDEDFNEKHELVRKSDIVSFGETEQ